MLFAVSFLIRREKHALRLAADRAFPVFRKVFERCAWRNASFGVADGGVVDPAAFGAFVLLCLCVHLSVVLYVS